MRRPFVEVAVVAAAAALLLGLAPVSGAATGCAARLDQRQGPTGVWSSYDAPAFGTGPQQVTAHAGDADAWFVSNGVEVQGSIDGGCAWKRVLELPQERRPDLPLSRQTDRIRRIAAAGGGIAVAVEALSEVRPLDVLPPEQPPSGAPGATTVVLWAAGGDAPRFVVTSPLLPPLGATGPLVVAPSNGRTVYATAGGRVHRTTDAGTSWAPAAPLPGPVSALAVHPRAPAVVFATVGGSLHRSTDGGASWTEVVAGEDVLTAVAVTTDENTPITVRVVEQTDASSSPHQLRVSTDGESFAVRPTGAAGLGDVRGPVQSGAGGARLDQLVLTTPDDVYSYDLGLDQLVAVDEFGLGPLLDVDLSASSFLFRTAGDRLVRWLPGARLGTPRRSVQVGPIGAGLPPLSPQTVLTGPREVALARDETAELDLDLDLGPEPTPLDVFFLLDTSGSMDDVVNGLANGFAQLARDLGQQRIDAHFGLGEYQDTAGTRYRRLLDLSAPGEPLRRALKSVATSGGAEPAWSALHQMSTGSGIANPGTGEAVRPGQGASWREGSLRVVVHATDELPSEDADGATRDQAVRALRDDGVRHIGIEVLRNRNPSIDQLRNDPTVVIDNGRLLKVLQDVSVATGALAPVGGVDCDGDGQVDLQGGQPLVCRLVPTGGSDEEDPATVDLASPLVRVLATLRDEQSVGVEVTPAGDAEALKVSVRSLSATTTVDVKAAAQLAYAASVTCAPEAYGRVVDLALRPRVGARTGTALPLRVRCEALPPGVAPPQPAGEPAPAAQRPVAAALPAPPVPPPVPANAPAPAQAPAQVPAPLPAGAVAANPALGLSPEQQEQQQLAVARQDAARQLDELAMVAVDRRPDTAALRLLPMIALTAGAAVVARRRRATVVGVVRAQADRR